MLTKIIIIAIFFTLVFTSIGFLIGGIFGRETAIMVGEIFFFISLLMNAIAYWYSPNIILKHYKAKPSENKELNEIVEKISINAKISVPKAYIAPLSVPNSFVTGSGKKATICATEGLLNLNKGEIEGVVAHGIWHIKDGDVKVQDFVSVLAYMLYLTVILIPLAILILKMSLSPMREYHADYYASRFSKKPKDFANALIKISEVARKNPLHSSPAFESIWLVDPFEREGLPRWFSTDPPTARRAKRLHDMLHEGMPEPPDVTEVD